MSRIDPIRRSTLAARAQRAERQDTAEPNEAPRVQLPVPVGPVQRVEPRRGGQDGPSAVAAQLIGQDGAKRGLRAGPQAFEQAQSAYNRTEFSGAWDRRAPKGGVARTDV